MTRAILTCSACGTAFPLTATTIHFDSLACVADWLERQLEQVRARLAAPPDTPASAVASCALVAAVSCQWCGQAVPKRSGTPAFCNAWHRANWDFDQHGYNAT